MQLFHMGDCSMGGRLNNLAGHKEDVNGVELVSRHKKATKWTLWCAADIMEIQ